MRFGQVLRQKANSKIITILKVKKNNRGGLVLPILLPFQATISSRELFSRDERQSLKRALKSTDPIYKLHQVQWYGME